MPRPCIVCGHTDKKAIDLALAAGKPANFVSQSFGVSVYAVQRHRAGHLRPGLVRAAERREELTMDGLIGKLQGYVERLERGMEQAESKADLQNLSRLVKESAAIIVRLGQLQGAWSERPQTIIDNRRQTVNIAQLSTEELRSLARLNGNAMLPTAEVQAEGC